MANETPREPAPVLVTLYSLDKNWELEITASENIRLQAASLSLTSLTTGIRRRIAIDARHLPAVIAALQEAAARAEKRWPVRDPDAPAFTFDGMPQRPRRPGVPR